MSTINRILSDERGLEAVEYAIVLGLVTVGTIAVIATIGAFVSGRYQSVHDQVGIE